MFSIGDKVCLAIDSNTVGIVIDCCPIEGAENQYRVFHDANRTNTYFESQLIPVVDNRHETVSNDEFLDRYAARKMRINASDTLFSLNAGKIKFIPFQFRPLTRILRAEQPRILIADEVGVGKTIETGIILKEFEKRENVSSVLIICPKDLTAKWRLEMKNKFDEAFEVLSSDRLRYCLDELEMEGEWPFECRKCIIGLELLRRDEYIIRLETMEDAASFDMLIVDEAHHVINRSSKSHQIVEYFCACSRIVTFLSATPLQLGSSDLYSLLNLLLPDEFMSESVFSSMTEPNRNINTAIRYIRTVREPDWQAKAASELSRIGVNEWARSTFCNNSLLTYWIPRLEKVDDPLSDAERIECLRDLESLHTFSHVINRTKRKDIGEFTIREPFTVLTEYTSAEQAFYHAAKNFKFMSLWKQYGERTAKLIMSTIERQITSSLPAFVLLLDRFIERGMLSVSDVSDDIYSEYDDETVYLDTADFRSWAEELTALAQDLPKTDSKATQLLSIIQDTLSNSNSGKLLVFSFFKHTLKYLFNIISERGIRVALVTGETPVEDRFCLRNRFRKPKEASDSIDVLLCSEVGCEGLDYEFCSRMVNYDIPWNPMKIEQRIGRIDRFGQTSPKVQIYNFVTEGTIEKKIFYRCYMRLDLFASTIGDLEGVLGDLATELNETAFDLSLSEEQLDVRAKQLADNAIRLVEEQRQFENASQELFLMDIDSKDASVENERSLQIQWQKRIVQTLFVKEYPNAICKGIGETQLKLRMYKDEKQKMQSVIARLKQSHKLDRNSRQVVALENYLSSDIQTVTLEFNADADNSNQALYISISHPFISMALAENDNTDRLFISSFKMHDDNILPKGKYVFTCYEWTEYGYRQANDVKVLLCDIDTGHPANITLSDFERMILSAEESQLSVPDDYSTLNSYLSQYRDTAKEKLNKINADIVSRKLSTLDNYYLEQTERTQKSLQNAKNNKMRIMYQSRLQKLNVAWRDKKTRLSDLYKADILVNSFASGILEVE